MLCLRQYLYGSLEPVVIEHILELSATCVVNVCIIVSVMCTLLCQQCVHNCVSHMYIIVLAMCTLLCQRCVHNCVGNVYIIIQTYASFLIGTSFHRFQHNNLFHHSRVVCDACRLCSAHLPL